MVGTYLDGQEQVVFVPGGKLFAQMLSGGFFSERELEVY